MLQPVSLGAFGAPAAADPPDGPPLYAVSEIKLGALEHDTTGLWSGFSLERAAADANVEVLFSPWARTFGGYLRPAIGGTFNFNGDTSKLYADVRWEVEAPYGVFFGIGLGAAIHDGHLDADSPDHKALGSRVPFHPSAELGYRFDGANSISIFADHISNGFTHRNNEGMDTVGVRFGHRFGPLVAQEEVDVSIADFSGAYLGALAGYQFQHADWSALAPADASTSNYYVGGYAGYSFQSGRGIFGIEVDASPLRSSMSATCVGTAVSCRMEAQGLYSVRSRFGWVIGNGLIYGTAGLAIAPWENTATNIATSAQLGNVSAINYGVAVGAGFEYKLGSHLGVRVEIMHYGLPGRDLFIQGTGPATDQFQSTVGRAGISWYFN